MALTQIDTWFETSGWEPFAFQKEVWRAYGEGKSGLIHSATGTGKTLAAWLGPVSEAVQEPGQGLQVLWITPLRALAADTVASLQRPLSDLGVPWRVELRTGDTTSATKAKQNERLPEALVTTPESLSIMLSRPDSPEIFRHLRCVVVDEWHELMSTKRGVQTELALARLRRFAPTLRTWGVSATLGNLDEAMAALVGPARAAEGVLVKGEVGKRLVIDSLLPDRIDRFPWAGHFGTQMIPRVVEAIAEGGTSLVFCNTRAMAEIWYQAVLAARPDWEGTVGLHHGSLDRSVRDGVEQGLNDGRLRAVVATSSLDLGVDFSPVDRVFQVGSPKSVARLLQRAGRSGHQPGAESRVTCVPTHAFELVDISAARDSAFAGCIESREGARRSLDVLAQHLVTIALGTGFEAEDLRQEVRETAAYAELTDEEFAWAIDFVTRGGNALRAYEEFQRVVERDGRYVVADDAIARRHRMSIGTITSDAAMNVQYVGGGKLGTVEEGFLTRLRPGDKFLFAGRPLEFVRIKDMTALVRRAKSVQGAVPRWAGGRLPLSSELSSAIRDKLEAAKDGVLESDEMRSLAPILELQARWSAIPGADEILIEMVESREGHHIFVYPFEGRLVHEGLAALCAYRLSRRQTVTFTVACNDYGFELLSTQPVDLLAAIGDGLFSPKGIADEIEDALNAVEMAKRQFREIARVAGLVFQGFPGMSKSAKQVQASSGLLFDVFRRFDPANKLLDQARREVLERQLEENRLVRAMRRLESSRQVLTHPPKPTPLSFPILVDRLRETVTSESLTDRIAQLTAKLEAEADQT